MCIHEVFEKLKNGDNDIFQIDPQRTELEAVQSNHLANGLSSFTIFIDIAILITGFTLLYIVFGETFQYFRARAHRQIQR